MKKQHLTLGIIFGTGLTLAAALYIKAPSGDERLIEEMAHQISLNAGSPKSMAPTTIPSRDPASLPENSKVTETDKKNEAYQVPQEQKSALKEYVSIQRKVFTSEREKNRAKELLNNRDFLKSIERLLTSTNFNDTEYQSLQNAAIDMLLEADSKYQSEAAQQILMNVVSDPQIESDSMPAAERQALAGVKAEVLYLWTAQNPRISGAIASALPGVVSQKIWNNVKATQEVNYQESLAETKSN